MAIRRGKSHATAHLLSSPRRTVRAVVVATDSPVPKLGIPRTVRTRYGSAMLRACVEDLLPMRVSPEQGVSFGPSQQPKGASNHGCKSAEAVKSRSLKESPPFSRPCVLRYPFLPEAELRPGSSTFRRECRLQRRATSFATNKLCLDCGQGISAVLVVHTPSSFEPATWEPRQYRSPPMH